MELSKKKSFVAKMGKKRPRFAKGGVINMVTKDGRRYFADGGSTVLGGPGGTGAADNAVNPNTGAAGTIANSLGLNNNFQATNANIQYGTNAPQLNAAYTGAQQGLTGQQQLASTLTPAAAAGLNTQNQAAQNSLNVMNGTGPNPALAELQKATGNNIAATAANMANVRGVNANPGEIAREAAQQGAATQQQSIADAATLQAQQQLAAQQRAADIAAQQVGEAGQAAQAVSTGQQNEQQILQGANTAANNASVGMQENINNVNAGVASQNQGEANKILGGVAGMASKIPVVGSVLGGLGLAKGGEVEMPEHIKMAEMLHHTKKLAAGGSISPNPLEQPKEGAPSINWGGQYSPAAPSSTMANQTSSSGPASQTDNSGSGSKNASGPAATDAVGEAAPWEVGGGMAGGAGDAMGGAADLFAEAAPLALAAYKGGRMPGPHKSHVANFLLAHGGSVSAMVSPGEIYLSPENVRKVVHEGKDPKSVGVTFRGRAKVKGDSLKNDTLPMTLETGGVVIDRKNVMSREKRELFVHKALAKKRAGGQ